MQDKQPYNEHEKAHGYWVVYYDNGKLWYNGYFINGEPSGLFNWIHPWYDNESIKQYYAR